MQEIKLMSKLGVALMVAIAVVSAIVGTQLSYNMQTADAQARLPNNSVRSENIVDGQVEGQDLASGSVTNAKMANDAVTTEKIGSGEVTSADIEDGAVTAADIAPDAIPSDSGTPDDNSVTSTKIVDGEVKTADIASGAIQPKVHVVSTEEDTIPPGYFHTRSVDCPPGEVVVGGGYRGSATIYANYPVDENTWSVTARNDSPTVGVFYAIHAVCMAPSP